MSFKVKSIKNVRESYREERHAQMQKQIDEIIDDIEQYGYFYKWISAGKIDYVTPVLKYLECEGYIVEASEMTKTTRFDFGYKTVKIRLP
jgi:hypothetical protein